MRRPLKPFVTEYKGSNRRAKDGAGLFTGEPEASAADIPARQPAKSQEPKNSRRGDAQRNGDGPRYTAAQPEDSYEAAMRAADALFSGIPTKNAPSQPSAIEQDAHAAHESGQPTDIDAASAGKGRILRVLDEEPDAALIDMEIERAPKKRGRKPGSKNKPKVALEAPSLDTTPGHVYEYESRHDFETETVARPAPAKIVFFPAMPSRSGEQFSWVRTKLGPGEAWKRRLPKVIW